MRPVRGGVQAEEEFRKKLLAIGHANLTRLKKQHSAYCPNIS